jgi:sugar lactone lactonase YvrE
VARLPLAFALALLTLAAPAQPAAPDSTWTQHLQAGRAALARDDRALARHHLLAVDSLVGGHTGAKSALATLAARDGRRDEALHWLDELAATGIARAIGADTTFARWRDDPAFRAVAARLDSNALPVANAVVAHSLGDTAMLAEDVVWDAPAKRFLVSSIHRRKIVVLDAAGRVTDFNAPGADGAWGLYALALDPKRDRLWATTAAGPECEGWTRADSGRTAVLAYDLRTARLVLRVELPRAAERQVLGDLAVAPDGTVYACESLGGAVYRLRPGSQRLETLVAPGTFRSPQMPVPAADGKRLYVADYTRGVAVVDLASGVTGWLPKPYTLSSGGIDGLYRDGDRLLAIQNGTSPHRVLELGLDRAGTRIVSWRVLEQASERLGEPNHGVIVGRDFFLIGDSGWDRVGDDGRLRATPDARPPVLLRLGLGGGR